jgi:hypothetical protein
MLLAALALAMSTTSDLLYTDQRLDVYREAYAGTVAEDAVRELSATPFQVVSAAIVAAGVIMAVLAALVFRRSNAARVAAWVLGGLLICGAAPSLVLEPGLPPRPAGAPPAREIERMLDEAVPAWATAADWTGLIVAVVALLTAIVLLGVPRANAFFRKPPPLSAPPPPLHGGRV